MFTGLVLRIIEILPALLVIPPDGSKGFTMYDPICPQLLSPDYCLMTFFIGSILAWKITPFSLGLSVVLVYRLAYFFDYWLIDTRRMIAAAGEISPAYKFKTFDFVLLCGSVYDFLSLCLINFLALMQIFIFIVWKKRRLA